MIYTVVPFSDDWKCLGVVGHFTMTYMYMKQAKVKVLYNEMVS